MGTAVRTYTRKKQENRIIENVGSLCRLCLEKSDVTVPIFKEGPDNVLGLRLRIMICVGIEITKEETLSDTICINCYHELEKYYRFRKKCELSCQRLKSHLLAVRERDNRSINAQDKESKSEIEDVQLVVEEKEEEASDKKCEVEMEEIQVIEQAAELGTDIKTFLTSILTELNILVKTDEGLVVQDQGVANFEVETGDDDLITFELVEEDHEQPATLMEVSEEEIREQHATLEAEESELVVDSRAVRQKAKERGGWCATCGKSFTSASAAARHAAVHSGARPHVCARCGRAFAQKAVRDRHHLVHSERRPFACGSCDKSFTQRGALRAHARAHAGARALQLHACPHCDKVFLYSSGLSRHMFSHTGRAYSCTACSRLFNDSSSLARHLRIKHATKPVHSVAQPPHSVVQPQQSDTLNDHNRTKDKKQEVVEKDSQDGIKQNDVQATEPDKTIIVKTES